MKKTTPHGHEAIKSIQKKLLGKKLTYQEVYNLMDEIARGRLSDILTTYFVASSFRTGFSPDELYHLTRAMVETGAKLKFDGIVADKHSTGGVAGTRTTLIVAPIIAACGYKIPKTSSRAITSPAGTADVMEVFADVVFSVPQIERIVNSIGACIVWGGHLGIAPADDVIIRIEEPLSFESYDKVIVSIMAKKVAVSTTHLVLDIPVGPTMKIKRRAEALKIEAKFMSLGRRFGMKIVADIRETYEPAGQGVGPVLEARDVLKVLEQTKDRSIPLEEKALRLAGKLLEICYEGHKIKKDAYAEVALMLRSGAALAKFKEIVKAQGGNSHISSETLLVKGHKREFTSLRSGTIKRVNNFNLNTAAKILGAPQDKHAGIFLNKKIGHTVDKKEPLFYFYSKDRYRLEEAHATLINFPIYEIQS